MKRQKHKATAASSTALGRLRKALTQSEAQRHALLDSSLDCVICTDQYGRITEFNAAAERTFRISRAAALGKSLVDTIFPPSVRDFYRDYFFPTNGSAQAEMVGSRSESIAKRSDNTQFPAEFTVSKFVAGTKTMFTVNVRDITARAQAQEALFRLAAIVESLQDAITGSDLDGRIVTWNRGAELIYGYTADEVLGKQVSILTPDGGEEELAHILEKVKEGQQTRDIETLRRAKDGRLIDVSLTVSPILDFHGKVVGVAAIARDITGRKAAEEALRRATETSVYASPVPIIALDTEGKVTMWNPAAKRVFGWSEKEVLGKPNPVVPENETEETKRLYRRLLSGETVTGVELQQRKWDGTLVTISLSANPLRDKSGRVRGIIKFLTDITAQKHVEEALRAAEEKYRSIFENSLEGMYQVTPDGQYLSANPALARMLGFDSPEELIKIRQDIGNQEYVNPETRLEFVKVMEERGWIEDFEYQAYRKDGKVIWVSENARAVMDTQGKVAHFEGAVKDITRQRELEQEFRQMQKLEAIGQLAGGVAHDFNNILMAISSFSELIGRKVSQEGALEHYVDQIVKAVDRGSSLTQRLLAFSRKQVFSPTVVDLNALVRDQIDMLKRLVRENVELKFIPTADLGAVRVDSSQMSQVIMNLVINARDAMPEGGEVVIETANVEREMEGENSQCPLNKKCVVLTVRDTGCGMDPTTQSHIFEPFFTTKEQGKGTGLGLATVLGIVKQSGGRITVDSKPGAGSIFQIFLPRVDEAVPAANASTSQKVLSGKETILLVEDEEAVRESAAEYLTENGYTVLVTTRGAEAIELEQRHEGPIHLLLTDLVMPKMGGIELAKKISVRRPDTKVILMSGYSSELFSGRWDPDSDYVLLRKPFRLNALGRSVRAVLDR